MKVPPMTGEGRVARHSGRRYPAAMRIVLLTLLLLTGVGFPAALVAAEPMSAYGPPPVVGPHPPRWHYNGPAQDLPFPRSTRAQAVWDGGACWSECGAYCAWALNACLYNEPQGTCVVNTDSCDLYCQRACRTQGGPWLPLD
jgi:hypothetical protein